MWWKILIFLNNQKKNYPNLKVDFLLVSLKLGLNGRE